MRDLSLGVLVTSVAPVIELVPEMRYLVFQLLQRLPNRLTILVSRFLHHLHFLRERPVEIRRDENLKEDGNASSERHPDVCICHNRPPFRLGFSLERVR